MSKTAQEIVDDIVIGWNLGNTLEEFKAISFALSIPMYFLRNSLLLMNCQPEYGRYASDAWSLSSDIISGIKSMIGNLADCVTGVADNIREFLHFSVPDKGSLTDYESWMPDFMRELADDINKSKKYVEKAVSDVAETIILTMQSDLSYRLDGVSAAIVGSTGGASVVNNYYNNDNSRTVNQTNNSPKSLSRLEIYRLTRNAVKQ